MRRHLALLVGVWLVCQVVGLAAAPLRLAGTPATAGAQKCTCPPGMSPSETCPMHRSHHAKRECVLKNAFGTMDTALLSLLCGLGLIRPEQTIRASMVLAESIAPTAACVVARPDRPESPPPRA
jgi:hypothetical protein